MKNRVISILLVLLLAISVMVACDQKTGSGNSESGSDGTGNNPSTESQGPLDHLPDMRFDGEDFRILGYQNQEFPHLGNFEFFAETDAHDIVNTAIFDRNVKVEDMFGVTIVYNEFADAAEKIYMAVMNDENLYDLSSLPQDSALSHASNGYLYNLLDLPHIDWENPWWTQGITDLAIYDQLYIACGDLMLFDKYRTFALIFNNDLLQDLQIEESPYEYQEDGTWTLDVMLSMAKKAGKDLNGDHTMDPYVDRYGVVYDNFTNIYGFATGSNIRFLADNTISDDGDFEVTLYDDNLLTFVDKMIALTRDANIAFTANDINWDWYEPGNAFCAGRALFWSGTIGNLQTVLTSSEFDYGVLSTPKLDEEQENYYNSARDFATVFVIPATISDYDKIGCVLEALGATSRELTIPAYVESTIMYRYSAETEECRNSLRLIFDTIVYDFGMMYDFGGGWTAVNNVIWSGENTMASAYGKVEFAIEDAIESLFEAYESMLYDSQS